MDDPLERFAGLYDQYYRNVLHYALQHAEQGSAEDVASEAFLVAWRRWPDIPEPPLPWLLGVARNLLRQQAAAGRRRRRLAERIAALTSEADIATWDAGEHVVERAAALDALASLPERDVEILTLVTWHGLDVRAAAVVAGCSPPAFTVRLHRLYWPSGSVVKSRKMFFGATTAETEESWTDPAGSRVIVNENVRFSFASAAGRARWVAAGRPLLSTAGTPFGSTRPETINRYGRRPETSSYWAGLGPAVGPKVTWAEFRGMPTTAAGLGKTLRGIWNGLPGRDKAGDSFGDYLFQWADALFKGPATPGTRAAMYQLLAGQPGITIIHSVTDPLGRTGVAVAGPLAGWGSIVVDPHTARELDYTSHPVHANRVIASSGTTVYVTSGWTNQIGARPQP